MVGASNANNNGTRPFKVLGLQQIAIGGLSKDRLRALWVDMLGLEVSSNFISERENVDEDIAAIGHGAFKVEVDLMQPPRTRPRGPRAPPRPPRLSPLRPGSSRRRPYHRRRRGTRVRRS